MAEALRIAVVIPCRNDAVFLESCLSALALQTRPADLVIVVDNGSDDDSAAVARRHGAEVVAEPVVGIGAAASRGYDVAEGRADVIARLDADSRPRREWIARLEAAFVDDGCGVVTGGAEFYDAGPLVRYLGEHWYIGGGHFWVRLWLGRPLVFGSNFAMRASIWREVCERVDRTDPRVHDDLDLSIRLRPEHRVLVDRTLRMPVSARPFATAAGLLRRVCAVVPTIAHAWPESSPWFARTPRARMLPRRRAPRERASRSVT